MKATVCFSVKPEALEGTAFGVLWHDDAGNPVTEADVELSDDLHEALLLLRGVAVDAVRRVHGVTPVNVEAITLEFGEDAA